MLAHIRPAIVTTAFFTLLLGVVYPLAITGVGAVAFPFQAGGSLLTDHGKVVGSALIGQTFTSPKYLHPRPSAAGKGYDASASSGSNYGPMQADLAARVKTDAAAVRASTRMARLPDDAVTASGSGLDPDISPAYASVQARRVANARGLDVAEVQSVIEHETGQPFLGFIGQQHVNVLAVNRALDARFPGKT